MTMLLGPSMPGAIEDRVLGNESTHAVTGLSDLSTRGQIVADDDVELFHVRISPVELGCLRAVCGLRCSFSGRETSPIDGTIGERPANHCGKRPERVSRVQEHQASEVEGKTGFEPAATNVITIGARPLSFFPLAHGDGIAPSTVRVITPNPLLSEVPVQLEGRAGVEPATFSVS